MIGRRQFSTLLAQGVLLSTVGAGSPVQGDERVLIKPGVQLYSVRQLLAQEPEACLQQLVDIGFSHVEWFDVTTLGRLGPIARRLGLSVSSCHVLAPYVTGDQAALSGLGPAAAKFADPEHLLDTLQEFQVKHLVVGYLLEEERQTLAQYRDLIEKMNRFGERCRDRGIQLAYHNHEFEFLPLQGERPFDLMLKEFDPALVAFELDVFWAHFAGLDPAATIRSLGQRCQLLHLKDLKLPAGGKIPQQATPEMFAELGQGELDFPAILAAAHDAGVQSYYIEQDWTSGSPLDSLKYSFEYLRTLS
jgi:sugar phosphate isomerase/epimerase